MSAYNIPNGREPESLPNPTSTHMFGIDFGWSSWNLGVSFNISPWGSTGNLDAEDCKNRTEDVKKKKCIKWKSGVRVVLIPSRTEYVDAKLNELLWWRDEDYSSFKDSAADELKVITKRFNLTFKSAMKMLYQPNFEAAYDFKTFGVLEDECNIITNDIAKNDKYMANLSKFNDIISRDDIKCVVWPTRSTNTCVKSRVLVRRVISMP